MRHGDLLSGPPGRPESNEEEHGPDKRAHEAGFIRNDLPAGLAAIMGGALVQFWLDSLLEIRAALAVTGDEALADEDAIGHIVRLLRAQG